MMNSISSFNKLLPARPALALPAPRSRVAIWLLAVLALIGFADATYLTVKHYTGGTLPCSLLKGCEVVTTSAYSMFAGLPVALFGALYYLLVFILLLAYLDKRQDKMLRWVSYLTELGFFASLWFIYLQAFVLKNFCEYCLLSAITSTLLFVISTILVWRKKS